MNKVIIEVTQNILKNRIIPMITAMRIVMAIDQGIITRTYDVNGYVCYVRRPADQKLPLIDQPLGDARTDLPQYCPPYKGDICIGGL